MHSEPITRRVVFFGDSRADWWHVPVLPGLQCIAAGVPGASAPYLARRFQAMVAPLRPDIVVVQMGVNDLTGLTPTSRERERVIAATVEAITAVVAGARGLGARVVLTTIFPLARGPFRDHGVQAAKALRASFANSAVNTALLALAGEGVEVFDSAAALAGADGYVLAAYADDELHLSPAGYAALNEALVPMLNAFARKAPKRILLTGMSGTGKSTLIAALAARNYPAVDMDEPGWSEHAPDGDWIWREDCVREFLAHDDGDALFVGGCATNQVAFYPQFDAIVLLSAPASVLIERLATRTNNPYGKRPDVSEAGAQRLLAEVLGYLETVEPLLRRRATHEIDTSAPFEEVLATVLKLVAHEGG